MLRVNAESVVAQKEVNTDALTTTLWEKHLRPYLQVRHPEVLANLESESINTLSDDAWFKYVEEYTDVILPLHQKIQRQGYVTPGDVSNLESVGIPVTDFRLNLEELSGGSRIGISVMVGLLVGFLIKLMHWVVSKLTGSGSLGSSMGGGGGGGSTAKVVYSLKQNAEAAQRAINSPKQIIDFNYPLFSVFQFTKYQNDPVKHGKITDKQFDRFKYLMSKSHIASTDKAVTSLFLESIEAGLNEEEAPMGVGNAKVKDMINECHRYAMLEFMALKLKANSSKPDHVKTFFDQLEKVYIPYFEEVIRTKTSTDLQEVLEREINDMRSHIEKGDILSKHEIEERKLQHSITNKSHPKNIFKYKTIGELHKTVCNARLDDANNILHHYKFRVTEKLIKDISNQSGNKLTRIGENLRKELEKDPNNPLLVKTYSHIKTTITFIGFLTTPVITQFAEISKTLDSLKDKENSYKAVFKYGGQLLDECVLVYLTEELLKVDDSVEEFDVTQSIEKMIKQMNRIEI